MAGAGGVTRLLALAQLLLAACAPGAPPPAALPADAATRVGVSEAEARVLSLAQGRCPDGDAARDAMLARAVRADDPAPIAARVAAAPDDATARSALAAVTGLGDTDRGRLACLLPHLGA
jgi:thioredoxin-like negative regulator of GroEL